MQFLPTGQLKKLNTKRLLALLNSVRAKHSWISKHQDWCYGLDVYQSNVLREDTWETIREYKLYMERIKIILATRKHIK